METFTHTLNSLWQILAVGVLLGAGLPTIFAFGVRLLSAEGAGATVEKRSLAHTVGAICCFSAVIAAIVVGILFIMKNFLAHDFGIHIF
ncbi:hypothetical protein [Antrihabitans sp. YC2-6]|uniref:hypothetical protein n=1 Tax=Antrihabitans sp. YC2-6 TaxID=2799498 RepID=UPI0018F59DE6|nr:hypothetical protein [Antrihabitans sp. YC2-6]MBJ8347916.1 hypothetical protein [Antrihabitans sp. YC2-6]